MKTTELTYQTRRIIQRVQNNQNDQAAIHLSVHKYAKKGEDQEPRPIDDPILINAINNLFLIGYDIYLETNQGYDDEGGDCYIAYLVKPRFKKAARHYWDMNYERDGQMLFNIALMEYIVKYPSHFIQIWAGPY